MTAAAYVGGRTVVLHETTTQAPGPGEVAIDVAFTGICGTDLHILHGDMDARVTTPAVLGHEMSGTVRATGEGVEGLPPGTLVTVMPLGWCGRCPACVAGHQHVCHRLNFIGIDSPGSMQTSWTVPVDVVIPVPPGIEAHAAALAEPTAVAVHDVRRAGVSVGDRVLVVGGGPIGLLIACLCRELGADVVVVELNESRAGLLAGIGLTVVAPDDAVDEHIERWTDGAGADVTFEVSGVGPGLDLAIRSARVRGTVTIVAIHGTPPPTNLFRIFWRELTVRGARVYEREDFERALDLIHRGVVPVEQLISATIPLGRAPEAFALLESGGPVMKVLVDSRRGSS